MYPVNQMLLLHSSGDVYPNAYAFFIRSEMVHVIQSTCHLPRCLQYQQTIPSNTCAWFNAVVSDVTNLSM